MSVQQPPHTCPIPDTSDQAVSWRVNNDINRDNDVLRQSRVWEFGAMEFMTKDNMLAKGKHKVGYDGARERLF